MIASGLCMMGGCFAQDATSAAVETYWPAHAVHMENYTVIIKPYAADLRLPFWVEGVRCGGRLENVKDSNPTNHLNWGEWGSATGTSINDALFLGSLGSVDGYNNQKTGAVAYYVSASSAIAGVFFDSSYDEVYEWMSVKAENSQFSLSCPLGHKFRTVSPYPASRDGMWQIRIKVEQGNGFDVVSYWWANDIVQKRYFVVQPMCSVDGFSAFYTHGYNILTEL